MNMSEEPATRANQLLAAALERAEGRTLEFKRVSGKMVHKAMETVCAFANTEGGILILGVEDPDRASGADRMFGIEENAMAVDELRRKLLSHFQPPLPECEWLTTEALTRDRRKVEVILLRVPQSGAVHSITDDGTWLRLDKSNRPMSAAEVVELSYRRGVRSAESDIVDIAPALVDTPSWRSYATARGLSSGDFGDKLMRSGFAERRNGSIALRRAAVLLFAEEPGALMATVGTRAEIRLFVYSGTQIESGATPNLRRTPRPFRGPLISLIHSATNALEDLLSEGLEPGRFVAKHQYPMRVVKEAVVNAVIHRDYRINRDIFIRVFDNRIEVESPGGFPGNISPATIATSGSKARNPLIARALYDFPDPPNIDAGEGVRMMFSEMSAAGLYPPQYRTVPGAAGESVVVTLLNEQRPALWEEVTAWLAQHQEIANADLRRLSGIDTLRASKMLKDWVDRGLLVPLAGRGKRNMAYTRPELSPDQGALFSRPSDNNGGRS